MYHISVLKINYLMMYVVLKVGGWIRANNPVIETNKESPCSMFIPLESIEMYKPLLLNEFGALLELYFLCF